MGTTADVLKRLSDVRLRLGVDGSATSERQQMQVLLTDSCDNFSLNRRLRQSSGTDRGSFGVSGFASAIWVQIGSSWGACFGGGQRFWGLSSSEAGTERTEEPSSDHWTASASLEVELELLFSHHWRRGLLFGPQDLDWCQYRY